MMLLAKKGMTWLRFDWFVKKFEKILLAIIVLFFFIVFPIFLLNIALSAFLDAKEANLRQSAVRFIDNELDVINEYSNNKLYYHNLLSNISRYAQLNDSPVNYMQANISNLKNNYPGDFSFIVWDEKGKVIRNLTDWPGYTYAFEKVYFILKEITEENNSNLELNVDELDSVKDNINILRNVFGNAFLARNLKCPLKNGEDAGPFIVDTSESLSTAWYAIGKKISFVCFISKSLINDNSGLNKIVHYSNNPEFYCVSGYFNTSDLDNPQTDFPKEYYGTLKLALATFESLGESIYEDRNAIVKFAIPQPSIRTFVLYPKKEIYWQKDYYKNLLFYSITCILLLMQVSIFYFFLCRKKFLSLRWKIIALLAFVNAVPSIVIACVAYDYLYNKSSDLKNELIANMTSELKVIDSKSVDFQNSFENKIQNAFEDLNRECLNGGMNTKKIDAFYETFNKQIDTNLIVVASDSGIVTYMAKNYEFNKIGIKNLCSNMLNFTNDDLGPGKAFIGDLLNPENCLFVRNVNVNQGRLVPLKLDVFAFPGMCFYNFIKDKSGNNNDYCVFMFWNYYEFKKTIISKYYNTLKYSDKFDYLGFRYELNNYLISSSDFPEEILKGKNGNINVLNWSATIDKNNYLVVDLKCKDSPNWHIVGVCSGNKINKAITNIGIKLAICIIASFLLCIILAYGLSVVFLKPIKCLNEASLALKKGDFEHHIEVTEEDEFGYLEKIFNRIIESFGELKIAQNFQMALAPKNNIESADFKIYGKTQIMTSLGGDYFDSFVINDESLGILIGDVAGHGVASGLIMAMAKAGVLTADEETKLNPSSMMSRLNNILLSVNSSSLKRMMTMQYFVIEQKTGKVVYANAGHCFPLILRNSARDILELDKIGLPLGIKKNFNLKNNEFCLNTNETLLLYTDGTFEFTNSNNEKFEFRNFKKMLTSCFDTEAEKFYRNICDRIAEQRLGALEDDTTIVIVNRSER